METSERILERRLVANPDGKGSHEVLVTGTEWTPSSTGSAPIKSTWRGEIGKPLTNRAIAKHALAGRYGQKAQSVAAAKSHIVVRCVKCGGKSGVTFRKFSYLPQPGFYCEPCRESFRGAQEKSASLDKQLSAKLKAAAVKEYI